jgi:hypothetical protein
MVGRKVKLDPVAPKRIHEEPLAKSSMLDQQQRISTFHIHSETMIKKHSLSSAKQQLIS